VRKSLKKSKTALVKGKSATKGKSAAKKDKNSSD
jgi:hypothetical protein